MAGVSPGTPASPPGPAAGRAPAATEGNAAGTGFAALLGEAAPSPLAADGPGAGVTETPADPAGGLALPGPGQESDAAPAPASTEDLPQQLLALLGLALPAAPGSGTPVPMAGADSQAARATGTGPAILPSLPQPTTTLHPDAATRAAGDPAQLQAALAPATGTGLDGLPGSVASEGAALAADTLDTAPSSLLSPQAPAPVRSAPATFPAALAAPLPMPADPEGGFDDGLGARIGWLAGQQLGRAEIRLNPEQLGVVDIRLDLDGNRVSVELASASQDVRQALEASLVRLRDMLGQQGLELARADVGAGHGDGRSGNPAAAPAGDADDVDAGTTGTTSEARVTLRRHGLLDEYA